MSAPVFPNVQLTSEQLAFMLERSYEIGREHRHREDELIRHNNAQLEENRAQRRQIKQLEGAIRLIAIRARAIQPDVNVQGHSRLLVSRILNIASDIPVGEEYRYQEQAESFAKTILEAHGFEGVAFHDRFPVLAEHISLFLRDEIGV